MSAACLAPDPSKGKDELICEVCDAGGFKERIRLMFNGNSMITVDADTLQKHLHKFSYDRFMFQNFQTEGEIAKWPQRKTNRRRNKGE